MELKSGMAISQLNRVMTLRDYKTGAKNNPPWYELRSCIAPVQFENPKGM